MSCEVCICVLYTGPYTRLIVTLCVGARFKCELFLWSVMRPTGARRGRGTEGGWGVSPPSSRCPSSRGAARPKADPLRGVGGVTPEENFIICMQNGAFWWILRLKFIKFLSRYCHYYSFHYCHPGFSNWLIFLPVSYCLSNMNVWLWFFNKILMKNHVYWIRQYFVGQRLDCAILCPASKGFRGVTPEIFQNLYTKDAFSCILNAFEWACSIPKFFLNLDKKLLWYFFLRSKCPSVYCVLMRASPIGLPWNQGQPSLAAPINVL